MESPIRFNGCPPVLDLPGAAAVDRAGRNAGQAEILAVQSPGRASAMLADVRDSLIAIRLAARRGTLGDLDCGGKHEGGTP